MAQNLSQVLWKIVSIRERALSDINDQETSGVSLCFLGTLILVYCTGFIADRIHQSTFGHEKELPCQ